MDKKNHIIKNKKYYDYDRNMNLRYFNIEEFNSKDKKKSGMNMDKGFYARHNAQCSFVITSGYRTPFQNRLVNGVEDSSHTKIPCSACDISTPDSNTRFKILKSLLDIGFTRIGIGKGFIHVDDDPDKSTEVLWHYY